jgi:Bacterial regulatory protein, arsR family
MKKRDQIVEYLRNNGPKIASEIAIALDQSLSNVSTYLRVSRCYGAARQLPDRRWKAIDETSSSLRRLGGDHAPHSRDQT